jgi:hypothetical protein
MMALLFCERADAVHEGKGFLEVGEGEGTSDVVLIDDLPVGELVAEVVEFGAREGRDSSAAGNTGFAGEVGHKSILPENTPCGVPLFVERTLLCARRRGTISAVWR